MELAYRLAVEDSPLIQNIRKNTIVLITPVPKWTATIARWTSTTIARLSQKPAPNLVYWGKYVAHDNNRDGMSMALANAQHDGRRSSTYHPTVLHDLHESEPFLSMSDRHGSLQRMAGSAGDRRVAEDGLCGNRGVHQARRSGRVDPRLLRRMGAQLHVLRRQRAQLHRPLLRDVRRQRRRHGVRTVPGDSTARAWYRPNPPLPRVNWSIRNNINLQQSGCCSP